MERWLALVLEAAKRNVALALERIAFELGVTQRILTAYTGQLA